MVYSPYERAILDVLSRSGRWLTTKEIAHYGGMNWITAKKYLNILYRKKKLRKKTESNAIYWGLRDEVDFEF